MLLTKTKIIVPNLTNNIIQVSYTPHGIQPRLNIRYRIMLQFAIL